jgi:hypothetical protein
MRFLRRHQFLLCFLAVLVFSCIMVTRQFLANQTAHVEMREDFILLLDRGDSKRAERVYQMLIQALPGQNEKNLVEDLQRTSLLVNTNTPDSNLLLWKYHVSVKNELQRRAEQRLSRAVERADKQ